MVRHVPKRDQGLAWADTKELSPGEE